MNIKDKLKLRFLKPKTILGQWLNLLFIGLSASVSFYSYYLIQFNLCTNDACSSLKITKLWVMFSPAYILYGILSLVIGYFLYEYKQLPSIYADCIAMATTFCILFIGFLPIAISNELSSIT